MQIRVLNQRVEGDRIKVTANFWPDGAPTVGRPALVHNFDLPWVTSVTRRVEDSAGRWTTLLGFVVLPVVEVNGEWIPRPENPLDPYRTETVAVDAAAHARQLALAWAEREAAKRKG
ncbi:MAG: hypothetical protein ABW156_05810 [Jiangellaceae bacterium]